MFDTLPYLTHGERADEGNPMPLSLLPRQDVRVRHRLSQRGNAARLQRHLGHVSNSELAEVRKVVRYFLDL
jgi:hypothetical protein